jgi:hypothetical protein
LKRQLAIEALKMVVNNGYLESELIHCSNRGGQCARKSFKHCWKYMKSRLYYEMEG